MITHKKTCTILPALENSRLHENIRMLKNHGYTVYPCLKPYEVPDFVKKHPVSIVLLEASTKYCSDGVIISSVANTSVSTRIILMVEFGDFDLAAQAVQTGVDTFIQIPFTLAILLQRIEWVQNLEPRQPKPQEDDTDFRGCLNSYVQNRLNDPITSDEVSEKLGISRSTLHRKVKKTFGVSFKEYIDQTKLEKAKKLLENRDYRISEIAHQLGFSDSNYYSRWFKQHTRISPTIYRQEMTPRAKTIRPGVLVPITGFYSDQYQSLIRGVELGVETAFYNFGLDVDVYIIDTATNPRVASRRTWEAAQQRDIHLFAGCASSAVLQETMKAISKSDSLLITAAGVHTKVEEDLGVVFRWPLPTDEVVKKTLKLYSENTTDFHGVYTITSDYLFGRSLLFDMKKAMAIHRIEHRGNTFHPMGCRNFKPFFQDALKSGADTILLLNYGADTESAINFSYQNNINERCKLLVIWSNGLQLINDLGLDKLKNVYFGTQYWHEKNLPANNNFMENWKNHFGTNPSYTEVYGYICIYLYLLAMKETHGTKNIGELKEALENLTWEGLTAPREYIHPITHQTRKEYYLLTIDTEKRIIKPL